MNKFQMKFTRRVRSSVRQNIARGVLMVRSRQEEEEEERERERERERETRETTDDDDDGVRAR